MIAAGFTRPAERRAQPTPLATYPPRAPLYYVAVFLAGTVFAATLTVGVVALIIGADEGKPRPIEHALELAFSLGFLGLAIHGANTFIGYAFLIFDRVSRSAAGKRKRRSSLGQRSLNCARDRCGSAWISAQPTGGSLPRSNTRSMGLSRRSLML